jgi:hypothetical protein
MEIKGINRQVVASRTGIIKNNTHKICLLIDVAVTSDRNITQMEAEKELKYKNLSIEIQ